MTHSGDTISALSTREEDTTLATYVHKTFMKAMFGLEYVNSQQVSTQKCLSGKGFPLDKESRCAPSN